jgi:pimeloyl-ACP methyl ester carboxylesterase
MESSELLSIGERQITIVDRSPQVLKSPVPVIISPGWSENPDLFDASIDELLQSGRRVIALDYANAQESTNKSDYPALELGKAEVILGVIDAKGFEKVDVMTKSAGSMSAVIAASLKPEKFRTLVLGSPAGLVGPDKFLNLLGRFSVKVMGDNYKLLTDSGSRPVMSRIFQEGVKYGLKNPTRSIAECSAISKAQLQDVLKDLHRKGVRIAVISGVDDPIFPMERIQQTVNIDMVDAFASVKGGHDEMHLEPKFTKLAESLITSLENK